MAFENLKPKVVAPLDPTFQPLALYRREYRKMLADQAVRLMIGLKRGEGDISTVELRILPLRHPMFSITPVYIERIIKFLLWQEGAFEVYVSGCDIVANHLRRAYSMDGERSFDVDFLQNRVYEKPFRIIECPEDEFPRPADISRDIGRHLDGCRIGFDLGASDRKVSSVINGKVVFSEEVVWEPKLHSDPDYHYREIVQAIGSAAGHLPRVDAIGGSSAGIYIDNEPRVASLFRGVPLGRYGEIRSIFHRIQEQFGVPLTVINDGDVTALAGSMSLGVNSVIGIALGSSLAAGYINDKGEVMGWLNELAFAPIDIQPDAPIEEWSGDRGCGASYLSQQAVFRLALAAGIELPEGITDAEKLDLVQKRLEKGHDGAAKIWQTMGVYLGYAIALYANFYDIKHVLLLGRCTSGRGGDILLHKAQEVLRQDFPACADEIQLHLPDEKSRRVGQSVAAASLPVIPDK